MSDYYTWDGLTLRTTFSASGVRNVGTTIYVVLNFLIAFVGERLIMRHGQRKLLNNKPLPITDLSPFLPVVSTLKQFWETRRLPKGVSGLLMTASGAFGLSGRYLVNSFIEAELIGLNCTFVSGIVATQRNANIEGFFSPSAAWSPTALVRRAQQAASENNDIVGVCSDGIYSKVHYNVTTFCPSEQDVLGNWICTAELASIITPEDRINNTTVANFAYNSTFLYPYNLNIHSRIADDGAYSDLMAWSSNTTLTSLSTLSVRLIMAPNLSSNSSTNTSNFQCALKITNPSWSPPNINAAYILNQWADTMLGSLLDISSAYYQHETQSVLNAISMVAGSSNGLWDSSVAVSTGAGSEYGCNDYRTVARPQVFAILVALMVVLFVILVMTISDILWNKKSKFQLVVGSLPIGLLDWQLAMTKKLVGDDHITTRDLSACEYSWNKETHAIVCRKIEDHKYSAVTNEAKVISRIDPRCSYVWNSDLKTIEGRIVADDTRNSSSDVSISKGNARVTSSQEVEKHTGPNPV